MAALLASTVPAQATTVGLDGGGGCYGLGESTFYSLVSAEGSTRTDFCPQGSSAGYLATDFYISGDYYNDQLCSAPGGYTYTSVQSAHNLVYFYYNGYEYTSDN